MLPPMNLKPILFALLLTFAAACIAVVVANFLTMVGV